MGWGCYKHEWDAGSDNWNEALAKLCNRKMKEKPQTFGRDEQICPACYVELEDKAKSLESQVKTLTPERDAQAEAVKAACRMAYRASYLGFDRAWGEAQINSIQNKIVREQMQAIARAAVEGGKA